MELVDAKCPNCGANIQVDGKKDANICSICGTPFVTEKAIENCDKIDKSNKSNKVNSYKIVACILGYLIDVVIIICAFLCGTVGKVILLSYVAVLIITCVIVKSIKKEKIADSMIIFVGKWSLYVSTLALSLILELICFAFEVNFIGKILDKIEK